MNDTKLAPMTFALVAALSLGAPLEDGTFGGIITRPDGTHAAVVYLGTSEEEFDHDGCIAWARERGGELVTRAVFHLLRSTIKGQLPKEGWCATADLLSHDTGRKSDAAYAWVCLFNNGTTVSSGKSYERQAVAVRLIPLTA